MQVKTLPRNVPCDHEGGFHFDPRTPYLSKVTAQHKHEKWRECCFTCGAWIEVNRIDGEEVASLVAHGSKSTASTERKRKP